MPATCLTSWDMYPVLKLLQTSVFPNAVREAARMVLKFTRTDLCHERFDCDWQRDCNCLAKLLQSLDLQKAAATLREFCASKTHTNDAGTARISLLI